MKTLSTPDKQTESKEARAIICGLHAELVEALSTQLHWQAVPVIPRTAATVRLGAGALIATHCPSLPGTEFSKLTFFDQRFDTTVNPFKWIFDDPNNVQFTLVLDNSLPQKIVTKVQVRAISATGLQESLLPEIELDKFEQERCLNNCPTIGEYIRTVGKTGENIIRL